ncbi:MAG: TolC family protein, partial [Bacteroidales bacterium]|nr:TolC family protein [Bacteroidales bacterium]
VYQGFDFGRGLTSNNTYANRNTRNTSLGLSAQMTLFEYGRAAQKRAAQFSLDAALADLENAKDDIGIAVARAYLQVLYSKGEQPNVMYIRLSAEWPQTRWP